MQRKITLKTAWSVLAAAALLARTNDPTDSEIDSAITNICRCGTYPRVREAVRLAGRIMRGQARVAAAPPPGIAPADAARAVPALAGEDAGDAAP